MSNRLAGKVALISGAARGQGAAHARSNHTPVWFVARVRSQKVAVPAMRRTGGGISYGVVYLASDEASYVTGAELVIDGGYSAR